MSYSLKDLDTLLEVKELEYLRLLGVCCALRSPTLAVTVPPPYSADVLALR